MQSTLFIDHWIFVDNSFMFTVVIKTSSHYENKGAQKADLKSFQMMDETELNYSEELVNI